ncbi:MAG: nucleoside-diphosphate-sugar epimerase [Candidatus Azotimanducaceae bacterium]
MASGIEVASFALPGEPVPHHWQDKVKLHQGDITNAEDVLTAMKGIKTVFHLAAIVGGGTYENNWAITVEGSRNVYEAALSNQTKVVLASSIVVYGDQIQTKDCRDGLPHGAFQGAYSRAKMAQEKLALDYQNSKNLTLCVIRPANVYGVGSGPWVEGLFGMISMGRLTVIGDGQGKSGLVYVDNLVDAFVLAGENASANGRIYTVCDELDVSWDKYFHDLAAMKGIDSLEHLDRDELVAKVKLLEDYENLQQLPDDSGLFPMEFLNLIGFSNRFSSTRIRDELGWSPAISYVQALEEIRGSLSIDGGL